MLSGSHDRLFFQSQLLSFDFTLILQASGLIIWYPIILECLCVGGLLWIFDFVYFFTNLLLLGFLWWLCGFYSIAVSFWLSLPPPWTDPPTLVLRCSYSSGGGYARRWCVPSFVGRSGGFTRCQSRCLLHKMFDVDNLLLPFLPTVAFCFMYPTLKIIHDTWHAFAHWIFPPPDAANTADTASVADMTIVRCLFDGVWLFSCFIWWLRFKSYVPPTAQLVRVINTIISILCSRSHCCLQQWSGFKSLLRWCILTAPQPSFCNEACFHLASMCCTPTLLHVYSRLPGVAWAHRLPWIDCFPLDAYIIAAPEYPNCDNGDICLTPLSWQVQRHFLRVEEKTQARK